MGGEVTEVEDGRKIGPEESLFSGQQMPRPYFFPSTGTARLWVALGW